MHAIYRITNQINSKSYVGQTKNTKKRWDRHKALPKKVGDRNYKYKRFIQVIHYAIAKYGIENFTFKVLEEVDTLEEANIREGYWEQYYNSLVPNGYNIAPGGNVRPMTDETKRKISKANKGRLAGDNHPNWGKHLSEETRRKISESNKGKHAMSDETREKVCGTWIKGGERISPDTEFKKGHKTWNKGTKGVMKPPPHAFKKGDRPHNKLPDEIRDKIKNDTRSSRVVARVYGVGTTTVKRLRKEPQ